MNAACFWTEASETNQWQQRIIWHILITTKAKEIPKFWISNEVWTFIKYNFFSRSVTNASVSFEKWQHICFSIDTVTTVWRFYKDGFLTDMGVSTVRRKVYKWNIIVGGEVNNYQWDDFNDLTQTNMIYHDFEWNFQNTCTTEFFKDLKII